jgi:hypothetical protein
MTSAGVHDDAAGRQGARTLITLATDGNNQPAWP